MRYRHIDQRAEEAQILPRSRPAGLALAIPRWGGLLAVGWIALAVLMFTHSLWVAPSSLADAAPGVYAWLSRLLPDSWVGASRVEGGGRLLASALYVLVMLWLWAGYVGAAQAAAAAGLGRAQAGRVLFRRIFLGMLVCGLLTLPWPGLFTTDLYLYGAQGRLQVLQGLNPLLTAPRLLGGDPFAALTPWRDLPSAYGPVWLGFDGLVVRLGQALGGSLAVYVLLYKLLNLVLLALSTRIFWAITGQFAWPVARRAQATILFAWCPLLVLELIGNAHNDMLLVLFLLLGLWLHGRGLWPLAVAALVLSGLIKLPGFILLPAYLVLLWRTRANRADGLRRIAGSLGVAAGVSLLAYLPYLDPRLPAVIFQNPMAGFVSNSPLTTVRTELVALQLHLRGVLTPENLTERQALEAVRWPIWYGSLALWGAISLFFTNRVRDVGGLLTAWALTMYVYLVLASSWFQPWYITWLVPVLALLPAGRIQRAALLLAFGGTLFYAVSPVLPGDPHPAIDTLYYVPGAIFLPTLCYCAWLGWRAWQRRHVVCPGAQAPALERIPPTDGAHAQS